jgi:hypothetical protein
MSGRIWLVIPAAALAGCITGTALAYAKHQSKQTNKMKYPDPVAIHADCKIRDPTLCGDCRLELRARSTSDSF